MPKTIPTASKSAGQKKKKQDYTSLFYDDNSKRVNTSKEKRDELADLYRQKDKLDNGQWTSAADRSAAEAKYYADRSAFSGKYGDRQDANDSYNKYLEAMNSTRAAYREEDAARERTSKRSQVMLQGFHRDPVQQAVSEAELAGRQFERSLPYYQNMAQNAALMGSQELYDLAQSGLQRSGGNYGEAFARYSQAQDRSRADYLNELKNSNKSAYMAETMQRPELENRLAAAQKKRETLSGMEGSWTSGMGGSAESKADYLAQRERELDAEIARYQAALRYRDSLDRDNEMAEIARSISGSANFREMAEVGKAMVENRNRSARASVNSADYQPDDPDNNLQFAKAERQEREALTKAGYIGDLDSSYIPEEVKPVYYALFARNPQKAAEFASYWAEKGEAARWNALYEQSGKDTGERARAFIEGTFANTVAGLDPFGEGGQYAAKLGRTKIGGGAAGLTEKGLFNTGFGAGTYHSDLFGDISLGSAYQLGSSMLQSAANATLAKMTGGAAGLVGGAGTILLGSSAAASDYQEKIEQGWDENSARWHALAAGAAESIFEYVSLDKLVNQDVTRGFLKNFLVQGGVEASEEAFTTIANRITDGVISELSGNESQIQARTRELIEKGYEKGTAEKMAQQEWLTDLMSDALGGFLSGGLMSSGLYAMQPVYRAMGAIETRKQNEQTGARYADRSGETAALQRYAADNNLEWAAPEQSAAPVKSGEDASRTAENGSTDTAVPFSMTEDTEASPAAQQDAVQAFEEKLEQKQEKQTPEQKRSLKERLQTRKQNRTVGKSVNRVQEHIGQQLKGKSLQQQQEIRDRLVQQYGEGIAPSVYQAVTAEATQKAIRLPNAEAIRKARNEAVAGIQDQEMKKAVEKGYDMALTPLEHLMDRMTRSGDVNLDVKLRRNDGGTQTLSIVDFSKDGRQVVLSDGTTMTAEQWNDAAVEAELDTKNMVGDLLNMDFGPAAGLVFKKMMVGRQSGEITDSYKWIAAAGLAFNQGRANSITREQAVSRSVLDEETAGDLYDLGRALAKQSAGSDQGGVDAARAARKGKGPVGRIGYVDQSRIKGVSVSSKLQKHITAVNKIAKLAGVNVVWFASEHDAEGRYTDMSGMHDDGTIWIDINSGKDHIDDMSVAILGTMGHELTHFIKTFSPVMGQEFQEFCLQKIVETKGSAWLESAIHSYMEGQNMTRPKAEEEIVAQFCQDIFSQKESLQPVLDDLKQNHRSIWQKIKEFFLKFLDDVRSELLAENGRRGGELEVWDQISDEVKRQIAQMWGEALADAAETHRITGALQSERGEVTEMTNRSGETVAVSDENGHALAQLRSYDEGGRAALKKFLNARVNSKNKNEKLTQAEADQILAAVEEMYADSMALTEESKGFQKWSFSEVQRNLAGKPIFSWLKSNSEYGWSMDASLVCIKRRTLDAVFDRLIKSGKLDNFDMAQQSIVAINDIIRAAGFETACGLCYIDAKRYRAAMVAGAFCDLYNEMVESLVPKGKSLAVDYFNYGGNELIKNSGKGIDTLSNEELDFSFLRKIQHDYGKKTAQYKTAQALLKDPSMRKKVRVSDFMSSTGFTEIGRLNPELRKLYNAKKGSGGPKATEADTQYLHDILDKELSREKYYNLGGLRVQSFSDYIPRLVFDYVEMIGDMAAKKLPSHAYSKELMFALQFGMTGMKINMSLIPDVGAGGDNAGLNADGSYAWRDGQSFGSTVYGLNKEQLSFLAGLLGEKVGDRLTAAQGYKLAKLIQNTAGYSQNCGTIAIGVSDKQIEAMLDDPDIRMIIPYHKSGLNHILASLMNVDGFKDYTNFQNTKKRNENGEWANLPKGTKDFNVNEYMHKHGVDAKAAADAYLAWCDKKGYLPKFAAFREHPNYYKVLVDFNCYDAANGEAYAPQQDVKAVFPKAGDAFGSMKDLMRMALKGEDVLQGRQDRAVPKIIQTIERTIPALESSMREAAGISDEHRKTMSTEQLKERYKTVKEEKAVSIYEDWRKRNGIQKQNRSYLQAVERGDMETAQRMVDEAAKELGYVLSIFHGTAERFNVFRRGFEGIHLGNERQARQRAKISSDKAERSTYAWSDLRGRLKDFNQDTITSLVRLARNGVAWGTDWETEPEHYHGDTTDLNAVRGYIDDMVEQYAKGNGGKKLDFLLPTFDRDVSPHVMDLYARISNPLKVDHDILEWTTPNIARMLLEAYRGNGKEFFTGGIETVDISSSRIDFTDEEIERLEKIENIRNDENWDVLADILAAHGYDGIQYVNEYEGDRKSPSYIALHPEDVKLADPVTYYDKERTKPIPLTERFNPKNQDVRFQKRGYRDEGQMGLFGEDGNIQTGMFEDAPQPKSSGELFLEAFTPIVSRIKEKHFWTGKEFDKFFNEHPEMDFVLRFIKNDKTAKADLQAFAATINDLQVLNDLSWYTTQSPLTHAMAGYRGAVTKVRNAYKARANEIMTEKSGGRKIKLEHREYSASEVRQLFDSLNQNEAVAKLANKVFKVSENLGLRYYATNKWYGERDANALGANRGGDVFLRINSFAASKFSDQVKASTILHELIHACTTYAIYEYENHPYTTNLKPNVWHAVEMLEKIYGQARGESSLAGSYGMTSLKEFVAELAQPEFRDKLEKVSLLDRVLDAIKQFFGIQRVKGTSYLDSASAALDYLLDEIDTNQLRRYYDMAENEVKVWEYRTGQQRYQMRSYELPSDLELMDRAAESLSEAGGEEYWKALLESVPELAGGQEELQRMARDYKDQAEKLEQARKALEDQLKTTNRKLNTAGISGMVLDMMKQMQAHDAWNKGVAKQLVAIITDTYQTALDAVDEGASAMAANDIIYEGAMKAADVLAHQATHSEKYSYKWTTASLLTYYGEGGMQAIQDQVAATMGADFAMHRYRQPIQATAADRIVEQTERRMQKKVDEANAKNETLTKENKKLAEQRAELEQNWQKAAEQVTFLGDQLKDARDDYKAAGRQNSKERTKLANRIKALEAQRNAKAKEAKAWKERYEAEARQSAANAKEARDQRLAKFGQSMRAVDAEVALSRERVNAQGWEKIADQTAKQLDREMEQKRRLIRKLEAQVQREADILAGKLKPLPMQRLLQAAREEARKKAEEHKDEVFQNYKERKNQTAIRNRIKNLHAEMERDLLRPREGHFVPEALIRPVVELLDMVNTQTGRARSENAQAKIDAINAQYDNLKNDERYSQYYDETVKALLVELSSTLNGRSIYDLNSDELADVYTAMKAMRTTIRNAIRADLVEKGKEIFEIGNELRQELRQGKGAHAYLLEKYHMSMLNAQRAFNRFGGYRQDSTWNKVYRMLDNAQLDMLRIEMEATRLFDPVLKAKADFEKAQALTSTEKGALVDVGLRDENGRSVWITRGMMLSLYMHLQNEQNMKHLMYGGLTLPDFKRYYDGNPEAWGRGTVEIPALGARVSNLEQLLEEQGEAWVRSQYKTMEEDIKKMFESVRESIERQMTDYDRKWIEASKDFFDNFSRRELNRVTNSMYGFSKAKVDNYFPIVTDPNFLKSEFDSISRNMSLENAGFMKERVKASNPILLEDITRTVNRQISNVSRYAGLTEALKQFGNIYNVQTKGFTDSVKKAMAKSYGKTGQEYIQNLITDMVGGRSMPGTIFDRIKGNYAQAVLSANLSVTIKQAASYPTAAAVVGWKPLMKALAKGGRKGRVFSRADRALIDAYSPLLWKRSQGAIDTEIGDMAHAQDWTKKAKWLMGWIEKTDIATVGRLWYAAEYYVQDNFNLEKGTKEQIRNGESPFYQKVAEIFNRIVEETQPNYTVLQRPDILRNPNKLLRSLVMFSTQRFQNGQILMDAAAEYGAMRSQDRKGSTEGTKAARQEAKRKLTWAITSQAVSAVVLNAMTLLAGALIHRMNPWRDDDDEITLESTAGALLDGWVESLAGSFLGGSELYEALDSLLTGSTYYGNDVGGLSSINDFASALITMGQKAVKLVGDENSKPEDWANLAKNQLWKVGEYLSQMTGVPVANVKKILEGGVQHVQDAMETHLFSYEAGLSRSNTTNARRYAEAWEAGDGAKMQAVIDEMNRNLEKAGKSTDGARDAITKAAKERYEAGEIELDQYADFLRQAGYLKEDKIEEKIRDFLLDELVSGDRTEDEVLRLLTELGGLTEDKAWKKVMEWKAKSETGDGEDGDEAAKYSEYDALRENLRNGASFREAAADYLAHGYTEKQVRDAAKNDLKARFQDGEMSEGEAIDLLVEYSGKDENACWKTVQGWQGAMEHPEDEDYSWGQYDAIDEALAGNKDITALMKELTAHGVKEENITDHVKEQLVKNYVAGKTNETQLKNQLSRYCKIVGESADKLVRNANVKKATGYSWDDLDSAYRDGNVSAAAAKQALTKYGKMSTADADARVRYWDFRKAYPDSTMQQETVDKYYNSDTLRSAGLTLDNYVLYYTKASKATGTDKNGDGRTDSGSLKAAKMQIINSLNITTAQKDALYFFNGWSAKTIWEAPWH